MYGSQTGNAQSIAEGIHETCEKRGVESSLLKCDAWKKVIFCYVLGCVALCGLVTFLEMVRALRCLVLVMGVSPCLALAVAGLALSCLRSLGFGHGGSPCLALCWPWQALPCLALPCLGNGLQQQ